MKTELFTSINKNADCKLAIEQRKINKINKEMKAKKLARQDYYCMLVMMSSLFGAFALCDFAWFVIDKLI